MAEGQSLALTAHEGNANQREKQRETEHNDTIHPQILQKYLQVPVSGTLFQIAVIGDHKAATDGSAPRCDLSLRFLTSFGPEAVPVVNFYGLRRI